MIKMIKIKMIKMMKMLTDNDSGSIFWINLNFQYSFSPFFVFISKRIFKMEDEIKFSKSQKNKPIIIYQNHIYHCEKLII